MPTTTVKKDTNEQHSDGDNEEEEPKDMKNAHLIINELRSRCRNQSEQIMAWKKAYALQQEQNHRLQKEKAEQLNYLTSQLLLLESRIMRKQKQVSNVLYQRELTIFRQQKIIETLSSRLIDHGIIDVVLDPAVGLSTNNNSNNNSNDFDSLNDSDSAVVLEDADSDCNSSIYFGGSGSLKSRCGGNKLNNDVTIVRSISDAIETTNLKYNNTRRSNCFLRRPEVLETVYSVEEDPEPQNAGGGVSPKSDAVTEKRDKFKNRTEKCISSDQSDDFKENQSTTSTKITSTTMTTVIITKTSCDGDSGGCETPPGTLQGCKAGAVTNYNRVMSNHRSVTKPKDVKYKRINKAKSKSLEELRGRLRHWVERGSCNMNMNLDGSLAHLDPCQLQLQQSQQNLAQSYA
ncbi:uncharacterized protein LOC129729740 [Wyeomyia smithii]|uniref:uncharacterized protein LOC129729740 n=1 Tax=Wyeomyia smithii TaxID=174621 RepID=UPI002467C016|nr:uncharacterized protein LOC129729740 [Wyeomyia smithii]XP_055544513.1 uncharacterized protein LOC129729740 [Wyeomyia smithii]XP_055544514.1 uncharacterized protein LOC129729740 [Wyeomyia smithii]XP_055544515.1 uncharacterized protein LOC129729740 [Wyeomyia smithii]XP_055544516.1 uncharacterized protein LOC129729740 [Wyeomyia smithii]XP_055544517.1 uncharacterized protein LOC129729740 [Wyeomyia smithii]